MHPRVNEVIAAFQSGDYARVESLIRQILATEPSIIDSGLRVSFGNGLVHTAAWDLVDALIPRDTNTLTTSGWLRSLLAGRPVNRDGEPIPWFAYAAIDFLEPRIRPEWRVFEWGAGFSTLWWAKRVASVHSVDTSPEWYAELGRMAPPNVTLQLHREEASYVDSVLAAGAPFDVVVIDGDWRNGCARRVAEAVKPDGLIIFDNSDGDHFDEGVAHLMDTGWMRIDFVGLIPSYLYKNCTSVLFKDPSFLTRAPLPSKVALCTGPTCFQSIARINAANAALAAAREAGEKPS
ncbi:MAG: hypothetical protein HQL40_19885 [Alphaproteobacteria bacterium]|nr:hypothetical protein [Alphaproteobacteria bacterium]